MQIAVPGNLTSGDLVGDNERNYDSQMPTSALVNKITSRPATIVTGGTVVVASALHNRAQRHRSDSFVDRWGYVRTDIPRRQWAKRALGSMLIRSPFFGDPLDTILASGQVSLGIGLVEGRYGTVTALKVALGTHGAACLTTRGIAEVTKPAPEDDLGPSGASTGLLAYLYTRRFLESPKGQRLRYGLVLSALGIGSTVGVRLVDDNATDAAAHGAGIITGAVMGLADHRREFNPSINPTSAPHTRRSLTPVTLSMGGLVTSLS